MVQTEVILALFLGMALLASMVSRRVRTPYTTLLVIVGLALTVVPSSLSSSLVDIFNSLVKGGLFIGLVLPPLLFESIMSVHPSDFRAVYRPALLMATIGVLISTLVVGVILWKVVGLDPLVSFLFAALISPTDVATVIEIFARIDVPARLATLVEMESVFNDASAIAILTVILTSSATSTLSPLLAVSHFAYTLSGGALVGLGVAWGARLLQKHMKDTITQVMLTLVAVYGAYGLATLVQASGLIAVAMTGVFYGNSIVLTLRDKRVADSTREFWRVLAFIANAVAFFFIGVSTNISFLASGIGAILVAYAVVAMARITSVYPILSLTKVGGSSIPVSWINLTTLGGMRGALAVVLVSVVPVAAEEPVATLTFGVVMISILLQGPLLTRYASRTFGQQQTLEGTVKAAEEPEPEHGSEQEPQQGSEGEDSEAKRERKPKPGEGDGDEQQVLSTDAQPEGKDEVR
jgi:Na+:H+ antiporter